MPKTIPGQDTLTCGVNDIPSSAQDQSPKNFEKLFCTPDRRPDLKWIHETLNPNLTNNHCLGDRRRKRWRGGYMDQKDSSRDDSREGDDDDSYSSSVSKDKKKKKRRKESRTLERNVLPMSISSMPSSWRKSSLLLNLPSFHPIQTTFRQSKMPLYEPGYHGKVD